MQGQYVQNVNDYVKVELTQLGADILNRHNARSNESMTFVGIDLALKVDYKAGDWYKDQFWSILRLFGDYFILGSEAPFMYYEVKPAD